MSGFEPGHGNQEGEEKCLSDYPAMKKGAGPRRRRAIQPQDLMDKTEVADLLDIPIKSIGGAMANPNRYPNVTARLPTPIRKIGNAWCWRRVDVEKAAR